MHRTTAILVFPLLLSLAPAPMSAQPGPATGERPAPVAVASPVTGLIRVDGRLDEADWAAAVPVTDFTQQQPDEGQPATERTEVRFLYDEDALYIGARMYDSTAPDGVTSRLARRDQNPQSDILRIDLDTYRDRLNWVEFHVNPAGWRADARRGDRSWDPVWQVATAIDSLGWTAEIRIPLSQLRFSRDSVQVWGLQITRIIERNNEHALWSFWRLNEPGGPAFFGDLAGLEIPNRPRGAEVLPYAVARGARLASGDPDSPFHDATPTELRVGGDLRYLLTSNLTLSATVNPDFGQVEVDPAVVNLSAFETFFPERRPFFVEGSELFRFGAPGCNINCGPGLNLFYSRRVGRAPQGAALAHAAGRYADVPDNTTILGAAKLTGRTAGGYTVGVINALTRLERAEVMTAEGDRLSQTVEPLTNTFVSRVRRELRDGNLVIGGMLTSVDRRLDDPGLAAMLPRTARTGGVDVEYAWDRRTYRFYAALSGSHVAGDSAAMLGIQRSSARYLHRPDRQAESNGLLTYAYDPSATRLAGYGFIARLAKQAGDWMWDLNAAAISPGFETNDVGFQRIADWRWVNASLGRQFTRPTRYYRRALLMAGSQGEWNYDGDVTLADVSGVVQLELPNYWSTSVFLMRRLPSMSDRLTRGGPVVGQAGSTRGFFNLSTDPRHRLVLGSNVSVFDNDDGGSLLSLALSAIVRPAANVTISLAPDYVRSRSTDQYVTTRLDETATAFHGRRYVFAHLDQRQLSAGVRASLTLRPDLSLELFAQPLLASGRYHDFQEFAAPRTRDKAVYGRDVGTIVEETDDAGRYYVVDPDGPGPAPSFTIRDPDFNVRSLRGTVVLRWEWRPGSTLFLVWTQTRSGVAPVGDLDFSRDARALFDARPDNIFVLKLSYWYGL